MPRYISEDEMADYREQEAHERFEAVAVECENGHQWNPQHQRTQGKHQDRGQHDCTRYRPASGRHLRGNVARPSTRWLIPTIISVNSRPIRQAIQAPELELAVSHAPTSN